MPNPVASTARHTLTVAQVARRLADAGVPRSERRIKYFCQKGHLDADRLPSPTGPQWYVDPVSVPGVIGDLKQFDEQKRRRLQPAATGFDSPDLAPSSNSAAAGSSRIEPAASGLKTGGDGGLPQPAAAPYITQLETRIEEKDEVIGLLRHELAQRNDEIIRRNERERETNILIRGLQNLVLQLQPGSRRSTDVLEGDAMMQASGTVDNSPPLNRSAGV